jgi:uncharacterized protein with LGFP repeats
MTFDRLTTQLRRTLPVFSLVAAFAGVSNASARADDASPVQTQAIYDKYNSGPEWAFTYCPLQGTPQVTSQGGGAFANCGVDGDAYGAIYTSHTGTYFIWGESFLKWIDEGFEDGKYGYPISDTGQLDGGNGSYTFFEGTGRRIAIYVDRQFTAGNAITVEEPILTSWESSGWEAGPHGWPASEKKQQEYGNGRCELGEYFQTFDLRDGLAQQTACIRNNGSVYWE